LPQRSQPLFAVFGITFDELQASLLFGQRWSAYVDPEHVAEPQVFGHALVHHLLVDTAASGVTQARTDREIFVAEFAPDAEDLDTLGFVGLDEEFEFHAGALSLAPCKSCHPERGLQPESKDRYLLAELPLRLGSRSEHKLGSARQPYSFLGGKYFFSIEATIT